MQSTEGWSSGATLATIYERSPLPFQMLLNPFQGGAFFILLDAMILLDDKQANQNVARCILEIS